MSTIHIVDDDFAIEALVDHLKLRGHNVKRYKNAEDALENLEELIKCDLVVLDLMMERPDIMSEVEARGGFRTGMGVLQKIRGKKKNLPVIVFSVAREGEVIDVLKSDQNSFFISKYSYSSAHEISSRIEGILGEPEKKPEVQAFIVHGHDESEKLALKNYLQNTLHMTEPLVLHEQPSQGRTIIEKLEFMGVKASVVFVLLTPDDKFCGHDTANSEKRRARQNVIFEMGYFMGTLGRKSGRVILLHKGNLDLPSDIEGLVYIDINNGVESAGESIRREIDNVS